MAFVKAKRKRIKLKLAVTGPSGSGKTFSSLLMAKGLGKKTAVIDCENGSASLYSDHFDFDVLELHPPYTTDKYLKAIKEAIDAKYDVCIIDSMSHLWAADGGLLDKKEAIDKTGRGNSYTNWATITKEFGTFLATMLNAPIHIIATMRSKQDYSQETDSKGKKIIQKVGMAPVMREGIEYEFSVVFDVSMSHEAMASKDRTGLFSDKIFKITEDTGKTLIEWLDQGAENDPEPKVISGSSKPVGEQPSAGLPIVEARQKNNNSSRDGDVEPSRRAHNEIIAETHPSSGLIFKGGKYAGKSFKEVLQEEKATGHEWSGSRNRLRDNDQANEYINYSKDCGSHFE